MTGILLKSWPIRLRVVEAACEKWDISLIFYQQYFKFNANKNNSLSIFVNFTEFKISSHTSITNSL